MSDDSGVDYSVAKKYAVWRNDENSLDKDGNDPLDTVSVIETENNTQEADREQQADGNDFEKSSSTSSGDVESAPGDEFISANASLGSDASVSKEDMSDDAIFKDTSIDDACDSEENTYQITKKQRANISLFPFVICILVGMVLSGVVSVVLFNHLSQKRIQEEDIREVDTFVIPDETMPSAKEVVKRVSPCVVTIIKENDTESKDDSVGSAGTGFIVEFDGSVIYMITSYHVAEQHKAITVTYYDGTSTPADLVAYNEKMDIALLAVPISKVSRGTEIRKAVFGNSDKLEMGDDVILLGNALGFGMSAATGIVSATDRQITLTDPHSDKTFTVPCIQTDAPINPGNSGGPLFNKSGEVIAMVESKYADTGIEGIGYAIPINDVVPLVQELIVRMQER